MIINNIFLSKGGGEVTLECDNCTKYTITSADAKRIGVYGLSEEDFPLEFEDESILEFLSQKLRAIKYCTYLLEFSDKNEKTLRSKLYEKQYSSDVIDSAMDIMRKSGIVDDSSLCLKKYISLASGKLYGPYRIKSELLSKGFSSEYIKYAEENACIDFDETLRQLCEKLLRGKKSILSDKNEREKFKAKLSRYGYGFSEISSVTREFMDDSDDFE